VNTNRAYEGKLFDTRLFGDLSNQTSLKVLGNLVSGWLRQYNDWER